MRLLTAAVMAVLVRKYRPGDTLLVPRCLGWIETSSRGQPHVELAGEQVDDCFEVAS
jgi:hypothetical protein